MVFDNYTCKLEPTFANVHCLADLSSVRYKTSSWNEIKELIKSNYLIVPSLLNNKSANYDMEWSVGDEAIFRRTGNCTLERNWNEQPQSSSVFLTLLNVSPEFEQEVVFYFLSHSCMYSAVRPVFFRNFLFSSKLELLRTTNPPLSPSLSELSFGLIHNNFRTVTKWYLKWHFI